MTHRNHLEKAYGLDSREETQAFYTDWAATYDAEVLANGYATPDRCAAALARHVADKSGSILDIGCGTGLSGAALTKAGFTNLTGSEVNPDMLKIAKARGVYRDVWLADPEAPYPFETGTYDTIAAIGVIGCGAAPLPVLEGAFDKLARGGTCVFSFNDHTLEDPSFAAAVTARVEGGDFQLMEAEHGPHLPGKGIESRVYVLRRL